MNDLKKEQIKQLVILLIILVAVIVIAFVVENFVLSDDEETSSNTTEETTDEETENNTTSSLVTEYTINGMTKSEWEDQEVWVDEDIYEYIMQLFDLGLTEDLELDLDEIKDDLSSTDEYDEDEQAEAEAEIQAAIEAYYNGESN